MNTVSELRQDKAILAVLCLEMYPLIQNVVIKYAIKNEEKQIIQAEELFVKTMYRDLFDSDIFNDFGLLYKGDMYVISLI